MARTIWGSHDRFIDVYLKPYPGYYVSSRFVYNTNRSSLVMEPDEITKDSTGSAVVLTMLSTSLVTV